jgi:hypothetical protein
MNGPLLGYLACTRCILYLVQCSRVTRALKAALLLLPLSGAAAAQQRAVVQREDAAFLAEPGGTRLGRLAAGISLAAGPARAGHVQVTLEGWVFRASLRADTRDGHDLSVARAPEENLRQGPNGRILARLVEGALLDEIERSGGWVRVRRVGWVAASALRGPELAAARADTLARSEPSPVESADPRRAVSRRRVQLFGAPDSSPTGTLEAGVPVRVTARAGGWVRVEAQGWVRENEIRVADAGILTGVTAAELRNAPEEFRGRLLRWQIQFIALQTADELRPDFTPGQRYILARGPAPEYAFVYVVVPPNKLAEVSRLQPLASLSIVGRVLSGRSTYLANPILELVDMGQ